MWNFGFAQYLTSTLYKNKRAYAALSLEPKENAFFGPEELQITLKGRPSRVNYSSGPEVLPSHFKTIDQ